MSRNGMQARMARLVRRWRASGESGVSFARRHGIPGSTFGYWCRKVPAVTQAESREPALATFVPVRVAVDPDAFVLEIVWSGGERLHVRSGAAPDLVRAVVAALRSPC